MKNPRLIQWLRVGIAALVVAGLCPLAAHASYPILKLDFSNNNTATQTEAGFTSFTIGDSGKVVDGIKIQIVPSASNGVVDARWRGGPTGIPYSLIYRDFLFARPGGMKVTLSGLQPNTTYEITLYAFDTSSTAGGKRIADWLANGDFCLTAGFDATVAPTAADSYASTGTAVTDGTGVLVLEATPNANTTEQSGANNPYAFLNALVVSSLVPVTTSRHPVPADGATIATTAVELQWEPGMLSSSSNVYLGEDRDRVANATTKDPEFRGNAVEVSFAVGSAGHPYPEGLANNKTYYWRIDEVNELRAGSPWKGEVWSFKVASLFATAPDPVSGSLFADPNGTLTWTAGSGATKHHVYFGTKPADVQAGTGGTDKGIVTDPCYPTGMLELNKTYYWRVDEIDAATHTGEVWSFTTTPPGLGTITMDTWDNVTGGFTLSLLLNLPDYPDNPTRTEALTSFSVGSDAGLADNYGAQIYGWLYAPMTGDYTFWFSCADQGELWLSTNDDPCNVVLLASEPVWGSFNTFSHRSNPVPLVGGQKYYVMARWKDDIDWDHCQVAWQGTGIRTQRIIAGSYLSPYVPMSAYGGMPINGGTNMERTAVLRWKAGKAAVQHQLYFGTDPNAVRNAGPNAPEYKGTQALGQETYDPGVLALETTYYWRVDEVNSANPASPWVGALWSFTTGNFLVVDDFESYNDVPTGLPDSHLIYDTWIDGWNTLTNGATVGYADPAAGQHVAETTIVHGGRQAMPFFYDNNQKYSEAVRQIAAAQGDWTAEGMDSLSLWVRGYPATVGSFVEGPAGTYTMTAAGTDITGTADEFHFAYKKLTGPGTIIAKVVSVSNTHVWAKAAIMVRETLDANSKHAMICVTPGSGVASEGRLDTGGTAFSIAQTGITAPHWIKLERGAGGSFTVTHSADGVTWEPVTGAPSQTIWMEAPSVYIGLAVTAHNAAATCQAVFSNVTLTGTLGAGPWEHRDIGILSNTAEPLYVALNGKAVYHPEANILLSTQWTEWRIPLQEFAAQGVKLTQINSLALGVGTQGDTSKAGGSGKVYFDDLRLYRPAPAAGQ